MGHYIKTNDLTGTRPTAVVLQEKSNKGAFKGGCLCLFKNK